jgi:hypothetical protein
VERLELQTGMFVVGLESSIRFPSPLLNLARELGETATK